MSTTRKRLEALEQRVRKPVRVADCLRVLLTDDERTADDMTLVVRFRSSPVVQALLEGAGEPHNTGENG
jgi:hypothetical protein